MHEPSYEVLFATVKLLNMNLNTKTRLLTAAAAPVIVMMMEILKQKRRPNKTRKMWCETWLRRREGRGVLNMLQNELLLEDEDSYRNFLRMSNEHFGLVFKVLEHKNLRF